MDSAIWEELQYSKRVAFLHGIDVPMPLCYQYAQLDWLKVPETIRFALVRKYDRVGQASLF